MSAVPYAYIRRSATGVSGGDISREFQTDQVRALASQASDLVVIDRDWGKSGSRQKRAKRTGFTDLIEAVRTGRASVVYAYAADRLARDTEAAIALLNACETAGIPIVTREGTFAPGDRSARLLFGVQAMTNEDYSSQASEKRHATVKVIRARNVEAGRPESFGLGVKPYGDLPGEDLQGVLDAFVTAGSYSGAVRILNAGEVKPRRGDAWESTSVMRIVKRSAELLGVTLPVRKHQGSKTLAVHTFARLICCPYDGSTLTATRRSDRKGPSVGYFCKVARRSAVLCPKHGTPLGRLPNWRWQCPRGHTLDRYDVTGNHPRPWSVGEHVVVTWAREVLNSAIFASWKGTAAPDVTAEAATLDAKITRLGTAYVDGVIPGERYRVQLDALREQRAALDGIGRASVTFRMGIDWSLPPRDLNARLRDVVHSIQLDDRMRPIGAVWLREPTLPDPDDDESVRPNPDAQLVSGGWYLPSVMGV